MELSEAMDQERIDEFADCAGERQWIQLDVRDRVRILVVS